MGKNTEKKKINEKKWYRFDLILECIVSVTAISLAIFISEHWFDNSFWIMLLIVVLSVVILSFIKDFIKKIAERSAFFRRFFEE